jgi:hypothetical protein
MRSRLYVNNKTTQFQGLIELSVANLNPQAVFNGWNNSDKRIYIHTHTHTHTHTNIYDTGSAVTSARWNTQCSQVDKWQQTDSYQQAGQVFHCADVTRSVWELKASGRCTLAKQGSAAGEIHYKSKLRINFPTQSKLISVQQAPPLNVLHYSPYLLMITLNSVYKWTHNGEVMSTSLIPKEKKKYYCEYSKISNLQLNTEILHLSLIATGTVTAL